MWYKNCPTYAHFLCQNILKDKKNVYFIFEKKCIMLNKFDIIYSLVLFNSIVVCKFCSAFGLIISDLIF